ncbi:hypothetical protein FSOLCH5_010330 [Fusarium solani]
MAMIHQALQSSLRNPHFSPYRGYCNYRQPPQLDHLGPASPSDPATVGRLSDSTISPSGQNCGRCGILKIRTSIGNSVSNNYLDKVSKILSVACNSDELPDRMEDRWGVDERHRPVSLLDCQRGLENRDTT